VDNNIKNTISHRARALDKLKTRLLSHLWKMDFDKITADCYLNKHKGVCNTTPHTQYVIMDEGIVQYRKMRALRSDFTRLFH
jgi:hypothetical protein